MIVILHNIRSLHNVGSIFRTADAAGVKKIYLTGITPAPLDRLGKPRPQLTKVSLGAENNISWDSSANSPRAVRRLLDKLRNEKFKIYAIEQSKKSMPYYKLNLNGKRPSDIALVLGNEVKGIPKSILNLSDKILEIPMAGKKESLNVSVAFGIVAFHFIAKNVRQ